MVKRVIWIVLSLLPFRATAGENLLANPAFELVNGSMPAGWSVFIEPHPGAEARLDASAGADGFAAMVHNPEPYEKEPANNWSQNVAAPLAGSTVRLAGSIKTESATEAALWLQCWSKPWRLLRFATTSTTMPVYGTRDWTPVSMDVEIPQGTEVVVVRCVLLGKGTAWFDDVSLEKPALLPAGIAAGGDRAPRARTRTENGSDAASREGMDSGAPANSASRAGPHQEITDNLVEANMVLATTVQELRDANEALAAQVHALTEEVDALRGQVQAIMPRPGPDLETPGLAAAHVPPLVPHGRNPEEVDGW